VRAYVTDESAARLQAATTRYLKYETRGIPHAQQAQLPREAHLPCEEIDENG
jgi:hypothetical protein